jgi:octaprenyl-diphosphate synthase
MDKIRALVEHDFAAVNDLIIQELHSDVGLVENIGHYIVGGGGKRLRPLLTLLAAKALGYQGRQHVELAAVIEFIHTATLLHDDVVDISQLRRGRPTANANWGNAPSVLVGDFIYSRAFQLMVRIGSMDVMQLMSTTTNQIAEGEVLQLTRVGNADTSQQVYLDVITRKTAVLFAAAAKGAGLLAGTDESRLQQLYEFGTHLGIAFQLLDDVLDYDGDPALTGKNVGDDLAEGKPTLPLIHAINNGTETEAALVRQAITDKSAAKLPEILTIIKRTGALDFTRAEAIAASQRAAQRLGDFPHNPFTSAMVELAEFAAQRCR